MVEMVALRQSWRSSSALGGYKLKIQADLQQEVHMVQTTVFVPSGETLMPKTLGYAPHLMGAGSTLPFAVVVGLQ